MTEHLTDAECDELAVAESDPWDDLLVAVEQIISTRCSAAHAAGVREITKAMEKVLVLEAPTFNPSPTPGALPVLTGSRILTGAEIVTRIRAVITAVSGNL